MQKRFLFFNIALLVVPMFTLSCEEYDESLDDNWENEIREELASGQTVRCASAVEGQKAARLSCPNGQTIAEIDFASYGLPRGSCSRGYQKTSCHSSRSETKVSSRCLGERSCKVAASNALFGDPCKGKRKRLHVIYTCGSDDADDDVGDDAGEGDDADEGDDLDVGDDGDDGDVGDDGDDGAGADGDEDVDPGYEGGLTKKQIAALDGHILLINDYPGQNGGRNKIQILDANITDWNKSNAILWEYELKTGKDGLTLRDNGKYHDAKRVLDRNGEECILIAGDDRGYALFNLERGKFTHSNKRPAAETHTATILPGDNYAIIRTRIYGKEIQIFSGNRNDGDKIYDHEELKRAHDAVYDGRKNILWVYGSPGLRKYSFDKNNRTLKEITPRPKKIPWGGNHGMCAKYGDRNVFFANANNSGVGVVKYDESNDEWKKIYDISAKSVSYNPKNKELLIPQKGGTISHRSHRCITITENGKKLRTYTMSNKKGCWYKARWFVHDSFSHPDH